MEKNYEMYKMYANVAYTWYQGNSNLKKATQVMMGVMLVFYVIILISLYNILHGSDNFWIMYGTMFVILTAISIYFLNGMIHLINVCKELERQEDFWAKNGNTFAQKPESMTKKQELVFNAVQEVIKSNLAEKEQENSNKGE